MDKNTVPNLPTVQHILEDLTDSDIIKTNSKRLHIPVDDDILRDAHSCHQSYKQLDSDRQEQCSLSSNLEELNKQLVKNIESMKKQMHTE